MADDAHLEGTHHSTDAQPLDVFAPGLFRGRVALVTGAGTGIGRMTALGFARYGADLVLAGRTAETLEATATDARAHGGQVLVAPTDIRKPEQVDALRDAAYATFGHVDFLVNNAGGQFPAPPSQISDNGWRAVVDLNLNGTWTVINRFMGPMSEAGTGTIVNVVHVYSFDQGAPAFAHSGAARAGVLNLTRTLAPYLGRHGVTINALAPGVVDTAGVKANEAEALGLDEAAGRDQAAAMAPVGRAGDASEMAAIILFLCSPAARFVNGAAIVADGGELVNGLWNPFPPGTL